MPRDSQLEKRLASWGKVLTTANLDLPERQADELARERKHLLKHWSEHPWPWLVGVDPTTTEITLSGKTQYFPKGRPLIWTTDERDDKVPVKPFPNKLYLAAFADLLVSPAPERRIVLADKSRQMLFTTICCQVMMHQAYFKDARRCLISKSKLADSAEVLKDKVRAPYNRLPEWLRQHNPLPDKPAEVARFGRSRSYIRAVTQNVAEAEGRGGTISIMLIDEAARQFMFQQIMGAILPAAGRVWGITTPEAGTPGAMAFYAYFEERVEVGKP